MKAFPSIWRFVRLPGACLLLGGLAGTSFQSCSIFPGKPPLPKRASLEPGAQPNAETDYAGLIANADVIYFPRDRAAFGARSEPAALLLAAMQAAGTPFALGWDLVDASQQPLLDQLTTGADREAVIGQLTLAGSGRAREHCRAVLRDAQITGRQLALKFPDALLSRLGEGGGLTTELARELPTGFTPPPGAFAAFTDQNPAARGAERLPAVAAYRTQMVTQQFAAEQIVRHFREGGTSGKLLVFLRSEDLIAGAGVPYYVAQKIKLRQLVLDSNATPAASPTRLLTRAASASPNE